MNDINEGDLIVLQNGWPHHDKIGLVIGMQRSNWGIHYKTFWEDGEYGEYCNKFGCTPEITKYETENTIRVSRSA